MNKIKEEYKSKMIYCHNKECEYCDDIVGWCIICTWEEFESLCPIKDKIINNIEKYIVTDKVNNIEKETKLVSPDEWLIRLDSLRCEISEAKRKLEKAEECLYSWIKEIP